MTNDSPVLTGTDAAAAPPAAVTGRVVIVLAGLLGAPTYAVTLTAALVLLSRTTP